MITVNGVRTEASSIKLSDYLSENNYKITRIAGELNGGILPKNMYGETVLKDGDKVEIVSFVGGG